MKRLMKGGGIKGGNMLWKTVGRGGVGRRKEEFKEQRKGSSVKSGQT